MTRLPWGVVALRGGEVESLHRLRAVVVDADGKQHASVGDPRAPILARSAVKPFQALPLVEDGVADGLGLEPEDLALACASHDGTPVHVSAVRAMLGRVGAGESELACGPSAPLNPNAAEELLRAGLEPGRLHNNCSGKHAGMLGLARHRGWDTVGYHEGEHPVQVRALESVAGWAQVPAEGVRTGTDGCGVRTFSLALEAVARAFARLGTAGREGGAAREVLGAMRAHPLLVGGSMRLCTRLLETSEGHVVAKLGAEGIYGAWVEDQRLGVAVKVEDGARRAADPALLGVLGAMGALGSDGRDHLEDLAIPVVRNTRGEEVGHLEPIFAPEGGS